jgi:prepilin-type N-terminal cleavage/methylation domain-containing protein
MNLHAKGFTLIEVLVAAYVLLIGICAMLSLFTFSLASAEAAWDRTLATSHGEQVLEAMQRTSTLADIVSMDWNQWAKEQHVFALPQERLEVSFSDPHRDPLAIKVLIQWQRKLRVNTSFIETQLTK